MSAGLLRLEAFTARDRHATLAAVPEALSGVEGVVEDVHLFSDLSAALRISIPVDRCAELAGALDAIAVHLDARSMEALKAVSGDEEVAGTLSIVFAKARGDLRHEVPEVPG